MVLKTPKEGFLAKAVREHFKDLKSASYKDDKFKKALSFARRCYYSYGNPNALDEVGEPPKKRFRSEGGGRKSQAPEFRDALFEWFIGK